MRTAISIIATAAIMIIAKFLQLLEVNLIIKTRKSLNITDINWIMVKLILNLEAQFCVGVK